MKSKRRAIRDYSRTGPGATRPPRSLFSRGRSRRRRKGVRAYAGPLIVVMAVIGAGLLYLWSARPAPTIALLAPSVATATAPAERTAALAPLNLPADDAPHGSRMEWWYYNGILDGQAGARYAFHVAVFVSNTIVKHTVMHVALMDLRTGKRFASQSRTAGIPAQDGSQGFDFRQGDWQVAALDTAHVVRANFEGASLVLDLGDSRPVVAHRAAGSATPGLLDFGASGISYYYSRPRMHARGEITVAGKPVPVSGDVWFDHQWGDFDVLTLGWNWFALHLADGSDVMLYELFDMQGRKVTTAGTISGAQGATPIDPAQVELAPIKRWTSPHTGIDYVVEWRVRLPSGVFNVKPFVADSEFDSSRTTANIYWEGPVKVSGASDGEGFMELSGYDRVKPAPAIGK